MSDTPRTDEFIATHRAGDRPWALFAMTLERELRNEQEQLMMAGSQLLALRLQLKDAQRTPRPEDGFLTAAREVVESFEMAENVTREQNNALGKLAGQIALADKSKPQTGDA